MEDLVIRPSTKTVMASYAVASLMTIGGAIFVYMQTSSHSNWWIGMMPGLAFALGVMVGHVRLMMEKLTISNERLRYESGFVSKSTHTIDLGKVQDVRVEQSVTQRLLGMGRISVETSGGSSAITVANVDNPHKVADMILDRSRQNPHHMP